MWDALQETLAVVGDFGIVLLAVLVWRIKTNDLPHINSAIARIEGTLGLNRVKPYPKQ